MRICSVETCGKKHDARGYCVTHYARWKKYGSHVLPEKPDIARFNAKYTEDENGCWLWHGSKNNKGYAQFWNGDKLVLGHRWRFAYEHGVEIGSLEVLDHLCRVTNCVNPAHLQEITQRENILRGNAPAAIHARKTHCHRGHELTEKNLCTYPSLKGKNKRQCRECTNLMRRQRYANKKNKE